MPKIRTPNRTLKTLKILLDNQEYGMYAYALSQHLQIPGAEVYPTVKRMLEDGLIYLDREVSIGMGMARKYYKICEDKLPFAKHLVKEELSFWNGDSRHVE